MFNALPFSGKALYKYCVFYYYYYYTQVHKAVDGLHFSLPLVLLFPRNNNNFLFLRFAGKVGNWKDKITGDLNDLFDKVYNEKMAGSGLEFDFEIWKDV